MKHSVPGADFNDAFVNVSFEDVSSKPSGGFLNRSDEPKDKDEVYTEWKEENSGKATDPGLSFSNILRKKYPGYSMIRVANPYMFPIGGFPELVMRPIPDETMDSVIAAFLPFARKSGRVGGILAEMVKCGGFMGAWKSYDFLIYQATYPYGIFPEQNLWVLHEGPPEPVYQLLAASGSWFQELHNEVLVYDQGFWRKDSELWEEIQKASWDDVILKQDKKKAIRSTIKDFFNNEAVYKELQVPWKVIDPSNSVSTSLVYGPAGNGKTISLKAAMHDTNNPILYVRTLTNFRGDEAAIADIFNTARRFSPCIMILEDIDSHINERNRSVFLNQMDGLNNNDGVLLIATTNHLDRLDDNLKNRPSRFDRKYLFDDPDEVERRLYCGYWQKKLAHVKKVSFPDSLADDIAKKSDGLSFAYLKEAFVSTLVLLATQDDLDFAQALKAQVKELRDQVREHPKTIMKFTALETSPAPVRCEASGELATTRELLQRLTGPEMPKGLSTTGIMPLANTGLRRWI